MNRKERRASGKKEKVATYNFTEEQLRVYMEQHYKDFVQKEKEQMICEAMTLMLVLPLEVLMDHYWKKTYQKKIPEFVNYVLDYYSKWENGELNMDELQKDLWEYGGVRLEVNK